VTFIICCLAVYKTVHVFDAISPRQLMPWVKVLVVVVLGYGAALLAGLPDLGLAGLAVATGAGTVHSLLRMITYVGDMAQRKSLK